VGNILFMPKAVDLLVATGILTPRGQWASWLWILFDSVDDRRFHIDPVSEKGQEYQSVRIIEKDMVKLNSYAYLTILPVPVV